MSNEMFSMNNPSMMRQMYNPARYNYSQNNSNVSSYLVSPNFTNNVQAPQSMLNKMSLHQ
jgi:hypothetical protein